GRDRTHELEGVERSGMCQRGTLDWDQHIDRNALRMRILRGQLAEQLESVGELLAHADDPAAADGDSRIADDGERVETVRVRPGGDDLAVELWRGVEVVVVRGQPRCGERLCLSFVEHAERAAGLESEGANTAHHLEYPFELGAARCAPPRRTHAESCCTVG